MGESLGLSSPVFLSYLIVDPAPILPHVRTIVPGVCTGSLIVSSFYLLRSEQVKV